MAKKEVAVEEHDDDAKIFAELNKALGGNLLFRGNDRIQFNWDVVEYPCVSLGDSVGHWGPALGRITQFHGIENSGKTFLAILMAIEFQKKYPKSKVVWVDAESQFDTDWAEQLGLDIARLIVIDTGDGVDMFRALCGKVKADGSGDKAVPGILDLVEAGRIDVKLIVLDSIAAITPSAELGRDFNEHEIAPLAKFLGKAFKRIRPMLKKSKVSMICINQARQSMDYGGGLTYMGGKAYRHFLDTCIKLHPSTKKDTQILDASGKKVGHKIIATVEKNRGSSNGVQAEFYLDFTRGVVRKGEELATLADAYEIVKRPNNIMWEYDGISYKGKDAFYDALDGNQVLFDKILTEIKELKKLRRTRKFHLSDEGAEESKAGLSIFATDATEEELKD